MSEDSTPTHVQLVYGRNGRTSFALPDPLNPGNPFAKSSAFTHLDGRKAWAAVWAPLPAPFDGDYRLPGIDFDRWPEEYLQVGGRRGRMTFEARRLIDGSFRQLAIGRAARGSWKGVTQDPGAQTAEPEVEVSIGQHSVWVFPHEVWTSAQITPVFRHWFEHGELPGGLTIRDIGLEYGQN